MPPIAASVVRVRLVTDDSPLGIGRMLARDRGRVNRAKR
jgi:hypothetical protein